MKLPPDIAAKVIDAGLKNLIDKVAAGGVPTSAEWALLNRSAEAAPTAARPKKKPRKDDASADEEFPPFPAYVDSLKQAVAEFTARGQPCDVTHLQRAKRERPAGAFKGTRVHFVQSLFDWMEVNPFETPLPDAPEDETVLESKETLERRKLKEQYLAAKKRRLILDGDYTANADIERDHERIGSATRAALLGLRGDAPSLEGLSAAEIDAWLAEKIDKICGDLSSDLAGLYA